MKEILVGIGTPYTIHICDTFSDIDNGINGTNDHVSQICNILSTAFNNSCSPSYLQRMTVSLDRQKSIYYIYVLNQQSMVVGYCNVSIGESTNTPGSKVVFISNVAVNKLCRKQGIATMLLERVIDRFDTSNMRLEVDNVDNVDSNGVEWKKNFYKNLGFKIINEGTSSGRCCMKYNK